MTWADIQTRHKFSYGAVLQDPDGLNMVAQEWVYDGARDEYTIHGTRDDGQSVVWPARKLKKAPLQPLKKALDMQVGGNHYKTMRLQPIEACYQRYGIPGVKAAVHTKVDKYLGRDKGNPIEDIDKAIHCLELLKGFYLKEKKG